MSDKTYLTAKVTVSKGAAVPYRHILFDLYHRLIEETLKSSPMEERPITLFPPRLIHSIEENNACPSQFVIYAANAVVHRFAQDKDKGAVSIDEVLRLMNEFMRKHGQAPSHLLLPPNIVFNEVVYYMKAGFVDAKFNDAPKIERLELIIVPNSPMLAVALL